MQIFRQVIAAALFIGLVAMPATAQMCKMADPVPATPAQVAGARAGSKLEMVLEVNTVSDNQTLTATLLERIDKSHYRRTKKTVAVTFGSETRVVMGSEADLKHGAVVQTQGIITKPYALDAKRFVVISSFVRLE